METRFFNGWALTRGPIPVGEPTDDSPAPVEEATLLIGFKATAGGDEAVRRAVTEDLERYPAAWAAYVAGFAPCCEPAPVRAVRFFNDCGPDGRERLLIGVTPPAADRGEAREAVRVATERDVADFPEAYGDRQSVGPPPPALVELGHDPGRVRFFSAPQPFRARGGERQRQVLMIGVTGPAADPGERREMVRVATEKDVAAAPTAWQAYRRSVGLD
jgi:hypothetical protein